MTNTTSNIGNKAVPNQDAAAALKSLTQNMSQDQMQQLMAAMQKQQLQAMPKHKRLFMQAMQYLGPRLQAVVVHLDRFINFVTKPSDEDRNDVVQAARAPILFGTYVAIIFFGFGGLWTALAPLDSSSSAPGTLISSTNKKTLQFQQGGLVKAIYVKQGDRVKAGDPIVALEDTNFKANYEAILSQYRTLKAQESRLIAQKDNLPNIEFSAKLLQDAEKPEVAKILKIEKQVFEARRALVDTIEKHTMQRIDQNSKQIEGAREKKLAAKRAYEFLEERLKASKSLFAKGIISKQQLSEIETKYAEAKSNDLTIDTEIIRLEQETSRLEIELSQKKSELFNQTLQELERAQQNLGEIKQKLAQAKDAYEKSVMVSPVDGIVNVLRPTTIGGLVGNELVAEISPDKDFLVVEARVAPKDIGYVTNGMKAKLRFGAFKSRTTPTFTGKVVSISPDVVVDKSADPRAENAYYQARIEMDMEEFEKDAKRLNLVLLPGMQVDVQIITGTRTLLRYLLDPITDNMFKGLKEK